MLSRINRNLWSGKAMCDQYWCKLYWIKIQGSDAEIGKALNVNGLDIDPKY